MIKSFTEFINESKSTDLEIFIETLNTSQIYDLCDEYYTSLDLESERKYWDNNKNKLKRGQLINTLFDVIEITKWTIDDIKNICEID